MRKIFVGLSALLLLSLGALAQVTAELALEQDQFLPGESVPVAVRITNRSGRVLQIGETSDWLTFSIESQQVSSGIVQRLGDVPVAGAFALPPSKRAVKRVDIAPYFAIQTPGKYVLTCTVRVPGWENEITTPPETFYVIEGARIWEREVGLPASGTNSIPQIRKYLLQQGTYLKGQPRLYLRVTDETGLRIFKLQSVGTILSFSRPEPQVDSESNLHLLYQNGPYSFGYTVFSPDGDLILRQTWDYYGDSRPRLKSNDKAEIVIMGGMRRETKNDFPPPIEKPAEDLLSEPDLPDSAPALQSGKKEGKPSSKPK